MSKKTTKNKQKFPDTQTIYRYSWFYSFVCAFSFIYWTPKYENKLQFLSSVITRKSFSNREPCKINEALGREGGKSKRTIAKKESERR